jgi:hypothetical protein
MFAVSAGPDREEGTDDDISSETVHSQGNE